MFGSFYMAMPLAIIGKEFYSIYQDVDHEDAEKRLSLDAILQKERLQVNITMVSRLKNHATNARERLQQERLRPEEKEIALPYLAAVDSLGADASPEALREFRKGHLKMMVVMSKSLIKKKSHGVFSG